MLRNHQGVWFAILFPAQLRISYNSKERIHRCRRRDEVYQEEHYPHRGLKIIINTETECKTMVQELVCLNYR